MSAPRHRYGAEHARRRKEWASRIRLGGVICWRCGKPIQSGMPWDLGHADGSDTIYAGPEHRACNRGAAGRLSNARMRGKRLNTSEDW